jgi:hypothetical protein
MESCASSAYSPESDILVSAEDGGIRLVKRFKVSTFLVKPIDPASVKAFIRGLDQQASKAAVVDCSVC